MPIKTGNPEVVDKLKDIRELEKIYNSIFDTPNGKRVLEDLEKRSYLHRSMFTADAMTLAYKEGLRNTVLHIKTMVSMPLNTKANTETPGG